MPTNQKHRGMHPADREQFDPVQWPKLAAGVADLSWLLQRGYSEKAALKLVGDRYKLRKRQRNAILRISCSNHSAALRKANALRGDELKGRPLLIDGFNVLITLEVALSDGLLFECRDGCYRDIASVHGSYHKVKETPGAILLAGQFLAELGPEKITWLLDRPVSNSGRLRSLMEIIARENGWDWQIELVNNPDRELAQAHSPIATTDGVVLDHGKRWLDLPRKIIDQSLPEKRVIRLPDPGR